VGRAPVQVAFDPSGRHIVVSLNGENKIAVVDVAARKLLWKAEVGRGPVQVMVTPDGKTAPIRAQRPTPTIACRWFPLPSARRSPPSRLAGGRTASPSMRLGAPAFVTNTYADTVSAIDLASRAVTASYSTGKGPNGIAVR
jgi:YVTN family beta-propeller protein